MGRQQHEKVVTLSNRVIAVASVFTAIGIILGAWFSLESIIDSKIAKLEASTVKTLEQMQIKHIKDQLNAITTKEQLGLATKYDKIRKRQLEIEWFGKNTMGAGT